MKGKKEGERKKEGRKEGKRGREGRKKKREREINQAVL